MTRQKPSNFRVSSLCLGFCVSLFALSGCNVVPEETRPPAPRPAKLMTLTTASNQQSGSFPAVIRAVRRTDLAFQVGGQIVELNAVEGTTVQRGEVIARLDARSFEAEVERAEAQYLNANSEYERAQRLIEEDAISKSVVESRLAQRKIAKASLDTAKKNLSDTVLRAPFQGAVGRKNVEQFQNVSAQQPVLVLQSRSVEAIVNVPASFVLNSNRIRVFNVFVELDAAPGRRFPATFRDALGQADSSTQTFEARFNFTPPPELLVLTGMTATLFFETEAIAGSDAEAGVDVPLSAIMAEGDKRSVWVVKGRERALERRTVELANGVGATMRVTKGLKVGDTIVATGGDFLQEGERVRPWKE